MTNILTNYTPPSNGSPEKRAQLKSLIWEFGIYHDMFSKLSDMRTSHKIAISNTNNLFLQPSRPWRKIGRKINGQNHIRLTEYLNTQIVNKYSNYINNVLTIDYGLKLDSEYSSLVSSNYHLVSNMLPALIYIRNHYNIKLGASKTCTILENVVNKLIVIKNNLKDTMITNPGLIIN